MKTLIALFALLSGLPPVVIQVRPKSMMLDQSAVELSTLADRLKAIPLVKCAPEDHFVKCTWLSVIVEVAPETSYERFTQVVKSVADAQAGELEVRLAQTAVTISLRASPDTHSATAMLSAQKIYVAREGKAPVTLEPTSVDRIGPLGADVILGADPSVPMKSFVPFAKAIHDAGAETLRLTAL